jgi:DNA-directed RNA polymerase specialized sigma24 family protein
MMQMTNAQAKDALKSATLGINAAFAACGRNIDPDVALDLAQETICNVLASFDPAKATANGVNGYAYQAGKREALDYLRGRTAGGAQRRHDGEDSLTTEDDDGNAVDVEIASPWPSPHDVLAASERYALLDSEIADLTPAQRDAIKLTMDETADLDNAQRQNKMRAINTIVANLPKSLRTGRRSKAKGQKRK